MITSLPDSNHGVLKLDGNALSVGDDIDIANISNLTFVPSAGWYGDATFSWKGSDGEDYSAAASTVTVSISEVAEDTSYDVTGLSLIHI